MALEMLAIVFRLVIVGIEEPFEHLDRVGRFVRRRDVAAAGITHNYFSVIASPKGKAIHGSLRYAHDDYK